MYCGSTKTILDLVLPRLLQYHRHVARLRHTTAWLTALRLAVEFNPTTPADSRPFLLQLLSSSATHVEAQVSDIVAGLSETVREAGELARGKSNLAEAAVALRAIHVPCVGTESVPDPSSQTGLTTKPAAESIHPDTEKPTDISAGQTTWVAALRAEGRVSTSAVDVSMRQNTPPEPVGTGESTPPQGTWYRDIGAHSQPPNLGSSILPNPHPWYLYSPTFIPLSPYFGALIAHHCSLGLAVQLVLAGEQPTALPPSYAYEITITLPEGMSHVTPELSHYLGVTKRLKDVPPCVDVGKLVAFAVAAVPVGTVLTVDAEALR